MEQTISEYASAQGISPQRARELARTGKVVAKKVAGSWVISSGSAREKLTSRRLSETSRADLLQYLNTRSVQHASGARRARLSERVRKLESSPNPAAVLREMFAGSDTPEGLGGAALVRAALRGADELVGESIPRSRQFRVRSPETVSRLMRDCRALQGESAYWDAVTRTLSPDQVRRLERGNRSGVSALRLHRVFRDLGLHVSVIDLPKEAAE